MSKNVADAVWELLAAAGVRRCYGIVGDALNPTIDALRRNGNVEFIHVRHEEYGGFAAVADAYLTGDPVAICGTAGPGITHLINAMLDARKEGAPPIVITGDVETTIIDTVATQDLNPYLFFQTASLYTDASSTRTRFARSFRQQSARLSLSGGQRSSLYPAT